MSIAANYIDINTIVLTGDYVHTLTQGMAIRADCGVDGLKIVKVHKIEYKGGKTVIYLIPSESTDLTANLQTVDFSCVKPNSQKITGNFGNIPADWIWMYRGFRRGLYMVWNGTWDSIILKPGMFHYYNYEHSMEIIAILESEITWNGFNSMGLAASTWYYIYLNDLSLDTCIINPATTSFTISSTAPSFDPVRFKWYHPTNYTNCLWFFQSGGTSGVHPFLWHPEVYLMNRYTWERQSYQWTGANVQNIPVDVPLTIPTNLRIMMNFNLHHFWGHYVENYHYVRPYTCGGQSSNSWIFRHTNANAYGSTSEEQSTFFLPVDNNKYIQYYFNVDDNSSYQSYARNTSRYFFLPIGFVET